MKPERAPDPTLQRTFLITALIEGVAIMGAVGVYLLTRNMALFLAMLAVIMPITLFVIVRATRTAKARFDNPPGIVE